MTGRKDDTGKLRWDLLPFRALQEVVEVLTYGALKYDDNNWQKVPDARRRYFAASLRHLVSWWEGERFDKQSGFHHLAHACCCILFLLYFELKGEGNDTA